LGVATAEVLVEAARPRDRVERRVRDEPVDLAADEQPLLAVQLDPLHAALLHLARHVPDERVFRLVVVVVGVEQTVAHVLPLVTCRDPGRAWRCRAGTWATPRP